MASAGVLWSQALTLLSHLTGVKASLQGGKRFGEHVFTSTQAPFVNLDTSNPRFVHHDHGT